MSFNGKVAIVSGGSRGIGAQIVRDLAREGASVLFTYTSDKSANSVQEMIASLPVAKHHALRVDAASDSYGKDIAQAARKHFGDRFKLDVLVHNAGFYTPRPVEDETIRSWNECFFVNARSVMLLTQAALPYLAHGSRVVMISSDSARGGYRNETVYGGTKAILEHYARSWSKEWGTQRGITINCVAPGWIRTDMLTSQSEEIMQQAEKDGVGEPEDVSNVVLFLASDKARWISGATVPVNGGASFI